MKIYKYLSLKRFKDVSNYKKFFKENEGYLYSLPFILGAIMYTIQFVLGLMYEPNIIYTTLNVFVAALCFCWASCVAIKIFIDIKANRRNIIKIAFVLLFFVLCYAVALSRYGLNTGITKQISSFVLFCPSALLIGALVSIKKTEIDFFDYAEILSLVALPLGIQYVILLILNISPYKNGGIGFVDYMQFSYAYMPLLFIVTIQFVSRKNSTFVSIRRRKIDVLRVFCILIYWILILGCATRGTILGVLFFYVILIIYFIITKNKIKRVLAISCTLLSIFALLTYIIIVPSMWRLSSMNTFTSKLMNGKVATSNDASFVKKIKIDNVVKDNNAKKDYNFVVGVTVKNRMTIFKLAWKEAMMKPFTGMGPFGFTIKYGSYPHDVFLELLCELGFIFGGVAICFIIFCFIRLLIYCKKDYAMGLLLVFLCGYIIQLIVSGSVWARPVLMFGIGYSLCYIPKLRTSSTNKELSD